VARIAVVGLTVADVIVLPGGEPRESTGGGPLFAARALADQRGRPPAVATRCHAARLAAPILPFCERLYLRLDETSFRSVLHYRPDGEREHELAGLGSPWTADDLESIAPAILRDATWVHAAAQGSRDFSPAALQVLAAGGRHVALDAQGPLREAALGPLHLTGDLGADLLAHVQALKLSEEEAIAAFGTLDPAEIATRTGVAEVLVTLGATGARVAAGSEQGTVSSVAVTGVDPTGAGDSFLALYADGRAEGLSPLAAADAACADVSAVLAARLAASSGSSGRGRPDSQS
jgi:sugar/nucleoside kinase (ribokinase family)